MDQLFHVSQDSNGEPMCLEPGDGTANSGEINDRIRETENCDGINATFSQNSAPPQPIQFDSPASFEMSPIPSGYPAFSENKQSDPVRKKRRSFKIGVAAALVCCVLSGAAGAGVAAFFENRMPSGTASITSGATPVSVVSVSKQTGQALSVAEVAAKVSPAVVSITVTSAVSSRFGSGGTSSGSGSGVIFDETGYIVTNHHVVEGADIISVKLSTGAEYTASLAGTDSQTDLAVIKIEASGLPYVTFGDSDALQAGDLAVAIGNPLGELSGTVTTGIISATDREITIEDETMNLLQTDAAINPGNSGGALCNTYGEVIGIVNAKTSALGVEGLGFAIPVRDAKPVIEELLANGHVSGRASMEISVQEVTAQTAAFFRMEAGVYVSGVTAGGAADKAGLKNGDMLLSADGAAIDSVAALKEIIEDNAPGNVLEIVFQRNGAEQTTALTLGEAA